MTRLTNKKLAQSFAQMERQYLILVLWVKLVKASLKSKMHPNRMRLLFSEARQQTRLSGNQLGSKVRNFYPRD